VQILKTVTERTRILFFVNTKTFYLSFVITVMSTQKYRCTMITIN